MNQAVLEDRLGAWAEFRQSLVNSTDVLNDIAEFWSKVKLIPFNHVIDPYNQSSWPTPWDIIAENKYDELTLAIMIGYTIKLSEAYKDNTVTVRTLVDSTRTRVYNLVYVDDTYVLNYDRNSVVKAQDIDDSFFLENLVELARPR
jgi:hypothetical protein